jgi:hypothetical protein
MPSDEDIKALKAVAMLASGFFGCALLEKSRKTEGSKGRVLATAGVLAMSPIIVDQTKALATDIKKAHKQLTQG